MRFAFMRGDPSLDKSLFGIGQWVISIGPAITVQIGEFESNLVPLLF